MEKILSELSEKCSLGSGLGNDVYWYGVALVCEPEEGNCRSGGAGSSNDKAGTLGFVRAGLGK